MPLVTNVPPRPLQTSDPKLPAVVLQLCRGWRQTAYTDSEAYVGEEVFQTFRDGQCQRRCEIWTSIHACRTCVDMQFCDYCYEIAKASKPAFRKCNPDHDFFVDLSGHP
jgi:hypothetical protein